VVSCGRRAFEELDASQESLLAVRAQTEAVGQEIQEVLAEAGVLGTSIRVPAFLVESTPARREHPGAGAVGEEAVVADADEALGQHVEQEAADELGKGEGQSSRPTAAVVLEAEGDGGARDVQQTGVRDGDAVGVAGEVLEDVLGTVEGWLGVDDPLGAAGVAQELLEGLGPLVGGEASVELEAPVSERGAERCDELAAEEAAEDAHGQEEAGPAGLPGASVVGQAAGGDDTVHVGMMDQSLAPGVEDDEEADLSAEVARVGGDLLKRAASRAQEKRVDEVGAVQGERCQALGQREDDVGVGHRQHLGLAGIEPAGLGAALTLRAVTVAARVVGDLAVPAGVTRVDVPAETSGAAGQDLIDDPALFPTPRAWGRLGALACEEPLEDLGDLVPRSLGHLLADHELRAQGVQRTARLTHALRGHVRVDRRGPERAVA
jgi:hypothetical protein